MSWFEHGTSRIYYEESGSGDPVLLMPGWSQGCAELAPLAQVLAASQRVIAVDAPGAGRSGPQPRTYTASYFDEDAALFAALLQHLGATPAHLMGFSDGGDYALVMATTTPSIARSVLTWGAAGVLNDPTGQLRAVMADMVDHPIPPMQGFRDYLVGTYGEDNARLMVKSESKAIGAIIDQRGGDLSFSKAGNITCPVLLIAGEHDIFVPSPLLNKLAGRIRSAQVEVVKDAGHDVHHSHAAWLTKTMVEWVKGH